MEQQPRLVRRETRSEVIQDNAGIAAIVVTARAVIVGPRPENVHYISTERDAPRESYGVENFVPGRSEFASDWQHDLGVWEQDALNELRWYLHNYYGYSEEEIDDSPFSSLLFPMTVRRKDGAS